MKKLSHSRSTQYWARNQFVEDIEQLRQTSTEKQRRFFWRLCFLCESNSVEQDEHPESRIDYAISIDKLIEKLQAAGVDIHGSGVKFAVVVGHDYEQAGVCVPFMRLIENPNSHSDG